MNHQHSLESLEHRRLLTSSISIGTVVDTAMRQTAQDGLIVVSRKGDLSEPLVVPLIVGGTAQNVAEYGRIGPQLTIPAGERSVAISVRPVFPGPAGESNYVSVALGQIPGVRFGNDQAIVNIVDNPDSTPPTIVNDSPSTPTRFSLQTQAGRTGTSFVIRRTGDTSTREVVDLSVGGTAQNGIDYGRIGNQIVFDIGNDTIVLPVRRPDPGFTGNRTVTVALPGAVPVRESSLVLNGIDLSGNVDPIVDAPDPVIPGDNTGVGIDPGDIVDDTPGVDTTTGGSGVGFDPTEDNGLDNGVGFDPTDDDGFGTGFGTGVGIGVGTSVGNVPLPGAVPTRRA